MKNAIKAEIRKLFTVRSTYGLAIFSLLLTILLSFYIKGLRAEGPISDPHYLQQIPLIVSSIIAVIMALSATLLVGFDYRHNTILYSMSAVRKRVHVLFAKIVAITLLITLFSVFIAAVSLGCTMLGLNLHHVSYAHQTISVLDILWRIVFYSWGYAMLALMIAFIARNMVASIVAFFLIPTTVEQLLSLLLGKNTAYLPFNALTGVLGDSERLSHKGGMFVTLIYIAVSGAVVWFLLNRCDAN